MATSPTQRTLAKLRSDGYSFVQVVEKWVPQARKRIDLFGFIDVVAIHPDEKGILGIQATSRGNISHRVRKIQELDSYYAWIANGNRAELWGWSKRPKKKGSKQMTWQVKVLNDADIRVFGRRATGDDLKAEDSDDCQEVVGPNEQKDNTGESPEKIQEVC